MMIQTPLKDGMIGMAERLGITILRARLWFLLPCGGDVSR
jgi:hypothetical protein